MSSLEPIQNAEPVSGLLENDEQEDHALNPTPKQIVEELDKYVISQNAAKRAVAIALRNRWRRMRVPESIRDEITPKNILMIGPTGVGKTEISRRLAKLAGAPFVKVEASKFTEVGYVGRDVESIIRDLVDAAHHLEKQHQREIVAEQAQRQAEESLLDVLLPDSNQAQEENDTSLGTNGYGEHSNATREKLRQQLRDGLLEERIVEIETQKATNAQLEILGPPGFGEVEGQLKDMFQNMIPKTKEQRRVPIKEARELLIAEAQDELLDHDEISRLAIRRAEQSGIVFLDEVDKICVGVSSQKGPDISREGVQRDLLPLVEGCTVSTKHGTVKTDHILFIASGAFHFAKPSDLMPEFQGRFPIRVELSALHAEHFSRILREPKNALTKQYIELMKTEGVSLRFTDDAIDAIAQLTDSVNSRTENIGARRLHTLLERVLDQVSFDADTREGTEIIIDAEYVTGRLSDIVEDSNLSRFIL